MDKRTFIQHLVIHYRAPADKLDDCISYAEAAWGALTARGYGAMKEAKERATVDYYARLDPDQKDKFDKFWKVYNKKDGKQRAVKSWLSINPDDQTYLLIIRGAEHEARIRNDRGTTPPWAELWLNEHRWDDAPAVPVKAAEKSGEDPGALRHALDMLKRFKQAGDEVQIEYWEAEARKLGYCQDKSNA